MYIFLSKQGVGENGVTPGREEKTVPSLVNLHKPLSISIENGRSWLPAFPRN